MLHAQMIFLTDTPNNLTLLYVIFIFQHYQATVCLQQHQSCFTCFSHKQEYSRELKQFLQHAPTISKNTNKNQQTQTRMYNWINMYTREQKQM